MFQEELSRTRELPVPPQPRRTGVLARSDDNLAGDGISRGGDCGVAWSYCMFPESNTGEILKWPAGHTFSKLKPFEDVSIMLLLSCESTEPALRNSANWHRHEWNVQHVTKFTHGTVYVKILNR